MAGISNSIMTGQQRHVSKKEVSFLLYIYIQQKVFAVTKSRIIISIVDANWVYSLCRRILYVKQDLH